MSYSKVLAVSLVAGLFAALPADAMGSRKSRKNNRSSSQSSGNKPSGSGSQPAPQSAPSPSNSSPKRAPAVLDKFQYQLSGSIKNLSVKTVVVDLFDTSTSKIESLKQQGKTVLCYFSAGTSENWRSDYKSIPSNIQGNKVDGWAGERWLDTRAPAALDLAKRRINLAAQKKCHGVDPDNVDGYGNNTGFSISKADSERFLKNMASHAHSKNLSIGLKNSAEIAGKLNTTLDFAVVEECFSYNECGSYSGFISKSKAVLIIEYGSRKSSWCSNAKSRKMSLIFADLDLDGRSENCP
jgi:hypothetical protein